MTVQQLGVAIHGAGNVSTEHLRAYLQNPHCEVVAISSRTKEGAERKARQLGLDPSDLGIYDSIDGLVADRRVDALSICTPPAGHASPANTAALVKFSNGAMGYVSACTEQWMPYVFNVDLFGDGGTLRANRFFSKKLPGASGFVEIPTVMPDSGDVAHHPFPQEIDHFVECIRTGRESHVSLHDAANTHEACFAADQSAAHDGVPITLPLA